jgi:hypothetical protein
MSARSSSSRTHTLLKVLSWIWCGVDSFLSCLAGENSRSKYSRESTTNENGRVRWHRETSLGQIFTQSYWSIVTVHRPFTHQLLVHYFFPLAYIPTKISVDEFVAVCCRTSILQPGNFFLRISKSIWKQNNCIPTMSITSSNKSEMREKTFRICRDYLNGIWKMIAPQEMVLKQVRWVASIVYFSICSLLFWYRPCNLVFFANDDLHGLRNAQTL